MYLSREESYERMILGTAAGTRAQFIGAELAAWEAAWISMGVE
jgi:hypothetical protein